MIILASLTIIHIFVNCCVLGYSFCKFDIRKKDGLLYPCLYKVVLHGNDAKINRKIISFIKAF